MLIISYRDNQLLGAYLFRWYEELLNLWGYIKYLKSYGSEILTDELDYQLREEDLLFTTLFGLRKEMKKHFEAHTDLYHDDFLFTWQIMWLSGVTNDSLVNTTSYNNTASGSGFSGGGGGR